MTINREASEKRFAGIYKRQSRLFSRVRIPSS